ncbi:hypothetical protein KQ51_00650 [Candidatus Izimaplasma bacterium HR1]|jgi:DUF438 domain-containing protein|uniref:DUF438 domain-containing protein n=1 Tax=Candidatus Izimoplasma sp. HR1 TaxID=1541959 RepID=UPI0004F67EC0|nr:hypothetical protein KQ51_00650 [Candidatus Izimaplasma bacterium HR1]
MSELINNRQEQLKAIIKEIHKGMPLDEAKALFKKHFESVTTEEITSMEQSLIEEGMPLEEVQSLCDVHAAVFDGSISDIHTTKDQTQIEGHPAKVFIDENSKIMELIEKEINPYLNKLDKSSHLMIRIGVERLLEIDKHYKRKENLFFPGLEKRGITSIPKVMWGVDDEIRKMLKGVKANLDSIDNDLESAHRVLDQALTKVIDMITKENNILIPMLLDKLSLYDWILADEGSDEVGYFLDAPKASWTTKENHKEEKQDEIINGEIPFDAGTLTNIEVNAILNTVPVDMTFVDKDGNVKYFTQGKERIFDRPHTVLGRHVNMCHPPQSVHIVEEIVESFKSGEKEHEDFWIQMGPMFVHIRYYAVRDKEGSFLGTLEVSQNIKPIRDLEGEKRLLAK